MSALMSPLNNTTMFTPKNSQTATAADQGQSSDTSQRAQFNQINAQSFLKLLTAQLQHQNPAESMNQQELASMMAQFSMATGINALNTKIESAMALQKGQQLYSASSLIGHKVTSDGHALLADGEGHGEGAFTLPSAAQNVAVAIIAPSGQKIDTIQMGPIGAGLHTFNWEGGQANRLYTFQIQATNEAGGQVKASPASVFTVAGVRKNAGEIELILSDNPKPMSISDVQNVL